MTWSKEFTVDFEPVAKGRPRMTRRGFAYTPAKTRDAEKELKYLVMPHKPPEPLKGAIGLTLIFSLARPKSNKRKYPTCRPDIDNYAKLVLDTMNELFYDDDSQIVDLQLSKSYVMGDRKPSVFVHIREIEENE